MCQRKEFLEIEIRRVCFLRGTNMSGLRISKEIWGSKTVVENLIKGGIDASVQKRSKSKSKLSQIDRRRKIRFAILKNISVAEISGHFEEKKSRTKISCVFF